jgi:hypothetical protein
VAKTRSAAYKARATARKKARHRRLWDSDPAYRERVRARERKHQVGQRLRRKYGLTVTARDELLVAQAGRCACCGTAIVFATTNVSGSAVKTKAVVDHCHTTGRVRAILCNGCNIGLGAFEDNPELLHQAAAYLRRQAA